MIKFLLTRRRTELLSDAVEAHYLPRTAFSNSLARQDIWKPIPIETQILSRLGVHTELILCYPLWRSEDHQQKTDAGTKPVQKLLRNAQALKTWEEEVPGKSIKRLCNVDFDGNLGTMERIVAFAEKGRNPELKKWVTAFTTSTPTESHAALKNPEELGSSSFGCTAQG